MGCISAGAGEELGAWNEGLCRWGHEVKGMGPSVGVSMTCGMIVIHDCQVRGPMTLLSPFPLLRDFQGADS